MRFAYIDSNGNEVPIPSVDALALRIELGAISENTQLYDAQADEWGPAHTHEIFHTLSRDAEEKDGFIAPPPVTPPPGAAPPDTEEEDSAETSPPTGPADAGAMEPPGAEAVEPPAATSEPAEVEETPPSGAGDEADGAFGLTLTEPPLSEEEEGDVESAPQKEAASDDASPGGGLPDLDLAPTDGGEPDEEPMDLSPPAREEEATGFDFGGMEDELEVEEAFEAPGQDALDFGSDGADDDTDLAGGMELETAREFDTGGFEGGGDDALDLETPMSDFSPSEPPSWMEEDQADDAEVLDFSAAGGSTEEERAEEGAEDSSIPERRAPRSKPSPPKFRKQRNLAVPFVAIVILLSIGIGGYLAWPLVSDRLSGSGVEEDPQVVIPPLDPDLVPLMREASSAALASIFEEARDGWAASSRVQEPPSDWLAGVYLARAGQYEEVEIFWSGMGDFLDRVRGIELATFDAALASELQARGVEEPDATAIRERADSGFVAAASERDEVFDRFQGLTDAALALHDFLVANEDNIEYAPAAAVTTDPVLEVDPSTPEMRGAMEDLLDQVTRALSNLEYRDRVTATGLRTMILNRIQERGIR